MEPVDLVAPRREHANVRAAVIERLSFFLHKNLHTRALSLRNDGS